MAQRGRPVRTEHRRDARVRRLLPSDRRGAVHRREHHLADPARHPRLDGLLQFTRRDDDAGAGTGKERREGTVRREVLGRRERDLGRRREHDGRDVRARIPQIRRHHGERRSEGAAHLLRRGPPRLALGERRAPRARALRPDHARPVPALLLRRGRRSPRLLGRGVVPAAPAGAGPRAGDRAELGFRRRLRHGAARETGDRRMGLLAPGRDLRRT